MPLTTATRSSPPSGKGSAAPPPRDAASAGVGGGSAMLACLTPFRPRICAGEGEGAGWEEEAGQGHAAWARLRHPARRRAAASLIQTGLGGWDGLPR
jgi:hypothetical protein